MPDRPYTDLQSLREHIVDTIVLVFFCLGFIGVGIVLVRAFKTNTFTLFYSNITIIACSGVVAYYRKRLPISVKSGFIIFFVFFVQLFGLIKFGFLASSKVYIIFLPILFSFILSYRYAFLLLFVFVAEYGFFGYLHTSGYLQIVVDPNEYIIAPNAWALEGFIFFVVAWTMLFVEKYYSTTVLKNFNMIVQKNVQLKEREEKYRLLFENSIDAVILTKDGVFIDANDKAFELYGREKADFIGANPILFSPERQPNGDISNEVAQERYRLSVEGVEQFFEWQHKKANGELFWTNVKLNLLIVGNEKLVQAVVRDITDFKVKEEQINMYSGELEALVADRTRKLEEANLKLLEKNERLLEQRVELQTTLERLHQTQLQLIESEKMASIGVLTSGFAHEINNPLNYIQMGVLSMEKLMNRPDLFQDPEKYHKTQNLIFANLTQGVQRIKDIVKSLHQFNTSHSLEHIECDLKRIIKNCVKVLSFETENRIQVETNFALDNNVVGNQGRLHQVFINILNNSALAITGRGKITITTQRKKSGFLQVTIEDTGRGIKKENLPRLFDPFFTTREAGQGQGLGLSIVYKIVEEHQGKIQIESDGNTGTIVTVDLTTRIN